ncbi:MAG TPA: hypothetical protein P5279_12620 [Anaerohalosphaeraceae bacterium]|jgi:hypothetical protein|nr:hypothetical protein [Anaerohalosphaeraceae bacterium]HRT88221.1 hypothetical protein [Anaerohalosphaeraceae bacterium]
MAKKQRNPKTYGQFREDVKRFTAQIARWQAKCDKAAKACDIDAARQYEQDVKDLTDILNSIEQGDWALALDLAWQIDTLVADRIPARLYNFIAKENGYC